MHRIKATSIDEYQSQLSAPDRTICEMVRDVIDERLYDADSKIWHAHPVWFIAGNPIVGYSKLKDCIRVLFWSGQSFPSPGLMREGSFKAAEVRYTSVEQIDREALSAWLDEARTIQWDYKNLMRNRGRLDRIG
ncbi:MAG: DUF1801 domain-containing protein [Devosia sp.]|uniref:DUF1801 domain-containing protein n=1 Tax=Devosia sp. TaxID=1871048 RepID=UPI0024CC32AF|nr:DUF1801 domain-containing protein [Devosia sp.]UYO00611.1 MAG: DUF1801 domain-containing protein [Devosia sp.]